MFNSFDGLPEKLLRKMWDDVWICIYCHGNDITHYAPPGYDLLRSSYKPITGAHCNKCKKALPYLDERHYGQTMTQYNKRGFKEEAYRAVWKKTPLWALNNDRENDNEPERKGK